MQFRTLTQSLGIAALVVTLAACAPVAAPAASAGESTSAFAAEATPEAAKEGPAADIAPKTVTPLDPAECDVIRMATAIKIGVELEMAEIDFANESTNQQGTSCTITATGTGKEFGNFVDVAQAIREELIADGWSENPVYLADGPTSTAAGFEKENKLALVHVGWNPAEDADCPDDQPISACKLEPNQQIFTVVIDLVQTS